MEIYRNVITWPDLKNKGFDPNKFVITNHAPPSSFLEKRFAESIGKFGGFLRQEPPVSLLGSSVNLSLLQTLTFWWCLASLYIRHTDLRFGNRATIVSRGSSGEHPSVVVCQGVSERKPFLLVVKVFRWGVGTWSSLRTGGFRYTACLLQGLLRSSWR